MTIKDSDRLLDIIEDHALTVGVLTAIVCAIKNGTPVPACMPVLNDGLVTDYLATICEFVGREGRCV